MNDRKELAGSVESLYIHIPFCISKCVYCDFFSRPNADGSIPDSYIKALCDEIKYRIESTQTKLLKTIYIGGGTPSLLSSVQFERLFDNIRTLVRLSADCEITVEVNPDDVSEALLDTLERCGVTRISCGIQSMNDKCLSFTCRRADSKTNKKALELFEKFWHGDLSIDLIAALPGDDEKSLAESIEEVCRVKPSHISLYSLTIEENTPLGRMLEDGRLDYDFDTADRQWLFGRDLLEEHGYVQYEVSNFCKEGNQCRHNLAYWEHKPYLGCGSGATGTVYTVDGGGTRWTNTTDIEKYISAPTASTSQSVEIITPETSRFEFFMMGLRKLSGISLSEWENVFHEPLPQKFITLFESWQKKGLTGPDSPTGSAARYALNREGILFLNAFLEELF